MERGGNASRPINASSSKDVAVAAILDDLELARLLEEERLLYAFAETWINSVEFRLVEQLQTILPPALVVLGCAGNAVAFATLRRPSLRRRSASVYMRSLAVIQTALLIVGCGLEWVSTVTEQPYISHHVDWLCRFWQFLLSVVRHAGGWLTVMLLVDRIVSRRRRRRRLRRRLLIDLSPIAAVTGSRSTSSSSAAIAATPPATATAAADDEEGFCSPFAARAVVAGVFFGVVVVSVHAMWIYELAPSASVDDSPQCNINHRQTDLESVVWPWMSAVVLSYVPLVGAVVLGVLLFVVGDGGDGGVTGCYTRRRRPLHRRDDGEPDLAVETVVEAVAETTDSAKTIDDEDAFTVAAHATAATFFLFTAPTAILGLVTYFRPPFDVNTRAFADLYIAMSVCSLASGVHAASTFIVYFAAVPRMRRQFRRLVVEAWSSAVGGGYRCRRRRRSSFEELDGEEEAVGKEAEMVSSRRKRRVDVEAISERSDLIGVAENTDTAGRFSHLPVIITTTV